ncbi:hypothetical protein QFC24_002256 [Naganishia onofrii]|uniref:Uncharacterized protein n=1 Tax=Naganishia onofrii TaxID=1851511 RepID=A0ACC2XRL0_9TREE|nr:hypothetical protein QFC24_002256 [Naganishia onofrii]
MFGRPKDPARSASESSTLGTASMQPTELFPPVTTLGQAPSASITPLGRKRKADDMDNNDDGGWQDHTLPNKTSLPPTTPLNLSSAYNPSVFFSVIGREPTPTNPSNTTSDPRQLSLPSAVQATPGQLLVANFRAAQFRFYDRSSKVESSVKKVDQPQKTDIMLLCTSWFVKEGSSETDERQLRFIVSQEDFEKEEQQAAFATGELSTLACEISRGNARLVQSNPTDSTTGHLPWIKVFPELEGDEAGAVVLFDKLAECWAQDKRHTLMLLY